MNRTLDPTFAAALRAELVTKATPRGRRTRRRAAVIAGSVAGASPPGNTDIIAMSSPHNLYQDRKVYRRHAAFRRYRDRVCSLCCYV